MVTHGITRFSDRRQVVIPSDGIYNSHRTTIMGYYFHLSTIAFKCTIDMRYCVNLTLNIYFCGQGKFGSAPIYDVDIKTFDE